MLVEIRSSEPLVQMREAENVNTRGTPMVSVVIVSWNAKRYLAQCLETLARSACTYKTEVLVVDNASTDGSPELVSEGFPTVRLIRNESNLGFSKANNMGIQQTSGKYVCLVNSDVRVLDQCITKLVDYMETHPKVGLAAPNMLGPDGNVGRSCRGFPSVWNMFCHAIALDSIFPNWRLVGGYALRYWSQDTNRPVDILGGWFLIVRRDALEQVGLLDEEFFFYGEDMDWCKRFHLQGWGVMLLADAASVHYGGGSSQQAPVEYYIQQQRADRQYWRKHHSKMEGAAYSCICVLHQLMRLLGHGLLIPISPRRKHHAYQAYLSWHCLLWLFSGAQ
jgi:GT2 family glycosyltransferase